MKIANGGFFKVHRISSSADVTLVACSMLRLEVELGAGNLTTALVFATTAASTTQPSTVSDMSNAGTGYDIGYGTSDADLKDQDADQDANTRVIKTENMRGGASPLATTCFGRHS